MSTHGRQTLYGNVGATSDTYFLINGNVTSEIALIGRDDETNLTLSNVEAAGRFPSATVLGEFADEQTSGGLRRFVVSRIAAHTTIAERAFELFQAGSGGTAERNWLDAERQLLGL
jgi:hypothetical protein